MKKQIPPNPTRRRTSTRAHSIIDTMLKEMQEGLKDPARMDDPEWTQLFGAKQSIVGNIQKLVQTLALLPDAQEENSAADSGQEVLTLTNEEAQLLVAWLASGGGSRFEL